MRLMHISDCHFGLQYKNVENLKVRDRLTEAREEALSKAVSVAGEEGCDAIVITGDLFESQRVTKKLVRRVCGILNAFAGGPVWVLPGNHDYYSSGGNPLWDCFRDMCGDHVFLFTAGRVEKETLAGRTVCFYPCICHDRHDTGNALGWTKREVFDSAAVNIGVAHGCIEGLSYDKEGKYYTMRRDELLAVGVDIWLVGHAHIPEPDIAFGEQIRQNKIYNAGTHQQTDVSNHTEGSVFVIDIDAGKKISARRIRTGVLSFEAREIPMLPQMSLEDEIERLLQGLSGDTVLRVSVSGTVSAEDYQNIEEYRRRLEDAVLYLDRFECRATKMVDVEMIDRETVRGSVEHTLMHRYIDRPELLSLVYDMVCACRKE